MLQQVITAKPFLNTWTCCVKNTCKFTIETQKQQNRRFLCFFYWQSVAKIHLAFRVFMIIPHRPLLKSSLCRFQIVFRKYLSCFAIISKCIHIITDSSGIYQMRYDYIKIILNLNEWPHVSITQFLLGSFRLTIRRFWFLFLV